jgi:hypothetical protein
MRRSPRSASASRPRQSEARAEERKQATQLRKVIGELPGQAADAGLAKLVEAGDALRDAIHKINSFGVGHPSGHQLASLGERAVKTRLMETPWARGFEHLSPRERFNFSSITAQWAEKLENDIARASSARKKTRPRDVVDPDSRNPPRRLRALLV